MTTDGTAQEVDATPPSPYRHVVAVFGSLQEALQAVQALEDTGYRAQDTRVIKSRDFPSALQEYRQGEGGFSKMLHESEVTTDEGSIPSLLEAPAQEKSAFLFLYMPQREHLDEVSTLLFNHGARLVKYVDEWSVEDLYPPHQEMHSDDQAR